MMQYRSVTTNIPLDIAGAQEEVILGQPYTNLLDAAYYAVHNAPSYGSTRIDFEQREVGSSHGWVRMSGMQIVNETLREDTLNQIPPVVEGAEG